MRKARLELINPKQANLSSVDSPYESQIREPKKSAKRKFTDLMKFNLKNDFEKIEWDL